MKEIQLNLGQKSVSIDVPDSTEILPMGKASLLFNSEEKIRDTLANPIDCPSLKSLVHEKLKANPEAKAVVVISDNTRPVPYSGKSGILYPLVDEMMKAGLQPSQIRLLVATGTHRAMKDEELRDMLDPRVLNLGLEIINHDSRNPDEMVSIGKTGLGGEILLNRVLKAT
jgi:nickel-dependent lactate racemase